MFCKLPLAESLEHVALPDELAAYRGGRYNGLSGIFSGSVFFGVPELSGLDKVLWLRAREHLISGDWNADAFESGDTAAQKSVHRDVWRFLEPNRSFTRVFGGGFNLCGILVSGRVSSLAGVGLQPSEVIIDETAPQVDNEHLEDGDAPTRARLYREIKALFERLDGELPLHECKPTFFARAREELGLELSEYILSQAWGNAEVNSERRKPGVRKQIE